MGVIGSVDRENLLRNYSKANLCLLMCPVQGSLFLGDKSESQMMHFPSGQSVPTNNQVQDIVILVHSLPQFTNPVCVLRVKLSRPSLEMGDDGSLCPFSREQNCTGPVLIVSPANGYCSQNIIISLPSLELLQ